MGNLTSNQTNAQWISNAKVNGKLTISASTVNSFQAVEDITGITTVYILDAINTSDYVAKTGVVTGIVGSQTFTYTVANASAATAASDETKWANATLNISDNPKEIILETGATATSFDTFTPVVGSTALTVQNTSTNIKLDTTEAIVTGQKIKTYSIQDGYVEFNLGIVTGTAPYSGVIPANTLTVAPSAAEDISLATAVRLVNPDNSYDEVALGSVSISGGSIISSTNPFADGSLLNKLELDGNLTATIGSNAILNAGTLAYATGEFGQGINNCSIKTSNTFSADAGTISAWVYQVAGSTTYPDATQNMSIASGGFARYGVSISIDTATNTVNTAFGTVDANYITSPADAVNIVKNKWIHICFSRDGKLSINGVEVATGTYATASIAGNTLGMVWNDIDTDIAAISNCIVDQIEIYNRNLTASEKTILYNQNLTKYTATIAQAQAPIKAFKNEPTVYSLSVTNVEADTPNFVQLAGTTTYNATNNDFDFVSTATAVTGRALKLKTDSVGSGSVVKIDTSRIDLTKGA